MSEQGSEKQRLETAEFDAIVEQDFFAWSQEEQQDFLSQTWCNHCQQIDLGMINPKQYASADRVWIEGECVKCGHSTITEIVEDDEEESLGYEGDKEA